MDGSWIDSNDKFAFSPPGLAFCPPRLKGIGGLDSVDEAPRPRAAGGRRKGGGPFCTCSFYACV